MQAGPVHGRTAHDRGTRVALSYGSVEGYLRDQVVRWRSIPYAAAPCGSARFRAPAAPQPWRGVRQCREFSFCAPQPSLFTLTGMGQRQPMSEDCLSLNVVSPATASDPLPVMFFIHGGGYAFGSTATGLYDGAPLARRGCIYVSANYRLGALGCLDLSSLATARYPIDGNLFLRDLVMALKWVQDNIAAFGGDPQNVTIFGESAGGHAVTALLAVPAAKGLFHRAIAQSPPAGMVRSPSAAEDVAQRFVHALGANPHHGAQAVMEASPSQLVSGLERLMKESLRDVPGVFGIGATVDGTVLPLEPVDMMAGGQAHQVPLIIGHNADEAVLFARFMNYLPTNEPTIEQLLRTFGYLNRAQFDDAYPRYPDRRTCVQVGGDVVFGSTAWAIAEAHSAHVPTYMYRYDYAPRALMWSGFGATHGTELLAVFDAYRSRLGSTLTIAGDQRSARRVSADIQRRWRAFSRTGVPGQDWPAYTAARRAVRVFDRRGRLEIDPAPARRLAWEGFSLTG